MSLQFGKGRRLAYPENAAVDEAAPPVIEHEAAEHSREGERHGDHALEVVFVLPHDDGALIEIADVSTADALRVLFEHHPAHVRVEQALANGVGILDGVGVPVVGAVASRPPSRRALGSAGADGREVDLER